MIKTAARSALLFCALVFGAAHADQPWTFGNNTRYLALGDSLAAGYGAMPATNGYTYQLYQQGVFDTASNTLFANAAVPGATSQDVLDYQLPQVHRFLSSAAATPQVITVSVGGNDLLEILAGIQAGLIDPNDPTLLNPLFGRLATILASLCIQFTDTHVYIGNLYTIQNFPISTDAIVAGFNMGLAAIVQGVNAPPTLGGVCNGRVRIADVFAAFGGFDGPQQGLLLINRNGAGVLEVHPTNAGYHAMAAAYKAAHQQ